MYNYNAYGTQFGTQYGTQYNPYANMSTLQELKQMREKIDSQIQQAQQPPQQPMMPNQPTNLTQNFQLAPQTNNSNELESYYAENIDEVKNTFVMKTGIFATKDLSTIWIKDVSGNIRAFRTEEILQKDEKDMQIQALQEELNSMKALMAQAIQQTSQPVEETPVAKTKTTKK